MWDCHNDSPEGKGPTKTAKSIEFQAHVSPAPRKPASKNTQHHKKPWKWPSAFSSQNRHKHSLELRLAGHRSPGTRGVVALIVHMLSFYTILEFKTSLEKAQPGGENLLRQRTRIRSLESIALDNYHPSCTA
eukprot:4570712-Amphidinium_carterae.2